MDFLLNFSNAVSDTELDLPSLKMLGFQGACTQKGPS